MRCAESVRVQAAFDGELDAISAADAERHCESCAECRALREDLERMRSSLRQGLAYERAPPALRARILRALDREGAVRRPSWRWRSRTFWVGAFSGVGGSLIAAAAAWLVLAPAIENPLLDGLVSAHVRSLMPDHLVDVVSTDKHTVKPWFAGHADVSPVVADFAQQGYLLVGGRADYFDRQRAAVVVYRHGAHVINVFSWAATSGRVPKDTTRNGYHLAFWKAGNLLYCAVTDAGWGELKGLVDLLRDLGARDLPD